MAGGALGSTSAWLRMVNSSSSLAALSAALSGAAPARHDECIGLNNSEGIHVSMVAHVELLQLPRRPVGSTQGRSTCTFEPSVKDTSIVKVFRSAWLF